MSCHPRKKYVSKWVDSRRQRVTHVGYPLIFSCKHRAVSDVQSTWTERVDQTLIPRILKRCTVTVPVRLNYLISSPLNLRQICQIIGQQALAAILQKANSMAAASMSPNSRFSKNYHVPIYIVQSWIVSKLICRPQFVVYLKIQIAVYLNQNLYT